MPKRAIDTHFWTHPTTNSFSPLAKLLYIYSFSNLHSDAAGASKISKKVICEETNLTLRQLEKSLQKCNPHLKYFEKFQILACRDFKQHQVLGGTFEIRAKKDLEKLPQEVQEFLTKEENTPREGIDTLSIPSDKEVNVDRQSVSVSESVNKDIVSSDIYISKKKKYIYPQKLPTCEKTSRLIKMFFDFLKDFTGLPKPSFPFGSANKFFRGRLAAGDTEKELADSIRYFFFYSSNFAQENAWAFRIYCGEFNKLMLKVKELAGEPLEGLLAQGEKEWLGKKSKKYLAQSETPKSENLQQS